MGSIAEGISAMSWSPDGELLVVFSQADEEEQGRIYIIICHGAEMQPLTDFTFSTADFGEGSFI